MAKDNIWEYDTTAANNTDIGGVSIAENMLRASVNNALRELMSQIRELANQGSDISSSGGAPAIAATGTSFYVKITGTTNITSFGTANAGVWRWVTFTGALTLVHNATSMILPGGVNFTTAAGTMIFAVSEGSGNWRVRIFPAGGTPVVVASDAEFIAQSNAFKPLVPSNLAARPVLLAHKNGTNQTGITPTVDTKMTFGTEVLDVGGYFASSTWTPPAGTYVFGASLLFSASNGVDQETLYAMIFKNGALERRQIRRRSGPSFHTTAVECIVQANGTDTFEIYGAKSGAGDGTVDGAATDTYVYGYKL